MSATVNKMKSWSSVQWVKYLNEYAKKLFSTHSKNSMLKVND